jgi:putative ABC transport system ATP-binding protein
MATNEYIKKSNHGQVFNVNGLMSDENVIAELIEAGKVFKAGKSEIVALEKTTLQLRKGELLLIIGPSGSGKTTLLSLLGCVLYPTEGCVCIKGIKTSDLSDREMAQLRLQNIGFVFQNFNLISPLSAEENIMTPMLLYGLDRETINEKIEKAMDLLRIGNRRKSLPKQLSGGEQQRVSIARAIVNDPPIILCDEPTAALDSKSMEVVLKELRHLADAGKAVAVVTHDLRLREYADKIIHIENGKIQEEYEKNNEIEAPTR